jgi:hypothetical protein
MVLFSKLSLSFIYCKLLLLHIFPMRATYSVNLILLHLLKLKISACDYKL